jgi:ankyrin repeat protein
VNGGANLNLVTKHDGSTAVWMASFHGHADVVEELFHRGADMNQARKHNTHTHIHSPDMI